MVENFFGRERRHQYLVQKIRSRDSRGLLRLMRGAALFDRRDLLPSSPLYGWRLWLIAWPVALQPPIRLVPLHPNTMGNVVCAWFGRNPWGGGIVMIVQPCVNCLHTTINCMDEQITQSVVVQVYFRVHECHPHTIGDA